MFVILSACLVRRTGWTKNMDLLLHWLSVIPFAGGGFSDAAIAEGLAEALMVSGCVILFLQVYYRVSSYMGIGDIQIASYSLSHFL